MARCGNLRHILAAPSLTGLSRLMEMDAGCGWADSVPTPRVSGEQMWSLHPGGVWVLEKEVQEDWLTAIWGLQALMGWEARHFPGR